MKQNQSQKGNAVVIVVLLIALVGVGLLWYNARSELMARNDESINLLDSYRTELVATCTMTATSTSDQRAECRRTLQGLATILESYKDVLEERAAATTSNATSSATTTATTTSTSTPSRTSTSSATSTR